MRRTLVPLAILLALVSGIVLAESRRVILVPALAASGDPRGLASATVVRQFYTGVNEALRTGDTATLASVLAPDLVDHAARPGATADRAGFLDSLRSLRTTAPDLQVAVLDVVAEGDRVTTRVRVDGGEDAAFLGFPVAPDHLWGAVDLFRVEAGRVSEHWSDASGPVRLQPLAATTATLTGSPWKVVRLARRTYVPGATAREVAADGPTLLWIEAGQLTVEVDERSAGVAVVAQAGEDGVVRERSVRPGDRVALTAGDAIAVPPAVPFISRNDERAPAVVVAVTIGPPVAVNTVLGVADADAAVPGITTVVLAGGPAIPTPTGAVTLALGRVTLAPGAALSGGGAGTEVVAVAAGGLALTVPAGEAWLRMAGGRSITADTYQELAVGQSVTVALGTVASYRNEGTAPLVLLVVTLRPGVCTGSAACGA